MSATGLENIDRAVHITNGWLAELMRDLAIDRPTAWRVLGAVLHTLRDRLTAGQAGHLGGQLPLIVRGLFFEQWHARAVTKGMKAQDVFLAHVSERMKAGHVDARRATQAVFAVLSRHPKGEITKIIKTLPPALRNLAETRTNVGAAESAFEWE